MLSRFQKIVCSISLTIFSTLSLQAFADGDWYKVQQAGYINSLDGTVESSCHPGDQLVKSLCHGRLDNISIPANDRWTQTLLRGTETALQDYPVKLENGSGKATCRPEMLRADQRIRLILTVFCKPSHS